MRLSIRIVKTSFKWLFSGLSGKTSWEWLELFIIPSFLAVGAFYLEEKVEKRQEIIAEERAKQETLVNYFDRMQELMIDKELRQQTQGSEVRDIARAITTITIQALDRERNFLLIRFLRESDLTVRTEDVLDIETMQPANVETVSLLSGLDLGLCRLQWL